MAYMSQEHKAAIKVQLAKVVPHDWKWSLSVRHHSTLVLTIASSPIDLIAVYAVKGFNQEQRERLNDQANPVTHIDINPHWWKEHFEGDLLETFSGIFAALNLDNFDKSDMQSDYFDVGHYVEVKVGRWDKPFVCTQPMKQAA